MSRGLEMLGVAGTYSISSSLDPEAEARIDGQGGGSETNEGGPSLDTEGKRGDVDTLEQ